MSVKPIQRAQTNSFVGGLVTEASPLAFPENASSDEVNFDAALDGRRFRRFGMDVEEGGVLVDSGIPYTSIDTLQYNTYVWEQAAGETGLDFLVVQMGNRVFFFRPGEEIVSVTGYSGFVDIPQFSVNSRFYMTDIEGYLVLVSGSDYIAIIEYRRDTNQFILGMDRIKIRDQFGVEETMDPAGESDAAFRPTNLNYQHYYNLYNQGWAIPRYDWRRWGNSLLDAVYLGSNKNTEKYPSNVDKVWLGIDTRGIGEDDDEQPINIEAFNYQQFIAVTGSDVSAAKGYFIIDALRRGQSRIDQWNYHKGQYPETGNMLPGDFNTVADFTTGGPSCVTEHAGRVWYSGFSGYVVEGDARSPNYNNYVFFTQVIRNKSDFNKCYQEGDPTSREENDVVESDGGFIKISEANKILAMLTIADKLVVIADNGVWSILGGSQYGFSATNYRVDKLSTFGGLSASSVVVGGSVAYFWGPDAIYMVSINQYGDLSVENISSPRIKTFYDAIDLQAKSDAYAMYDIYNKRVRWIYRDNSIFSQNVFIHELFLDTQLGAYFPFTIGTVQDNPYHTLTGFKTPPYNIRLIEDFVLAELEEVYVNDEQVVSNRRELIPTNAAIKYVGVSNYNGNLGIYFSRYGDTEFRDWKSVDGSGVDAKAYMLTGQQTLADVAITKYMPYLSMVFVETEKTIEDDVIDQESSCVGRVQWDFASSSVSNKWSRPMQLYRKKRFFFGESDIDNGYDLLVTKTKIRGRGKAFCMYLETEEYKDCQIYGWTITLTGNGVT